MSVCSQPTQPVNLYKVLGPSREPIHGGHGRWPEPGVWTELIDGPIEPCVRGYHLCEAADLPRWLKHDAVVWSADYQGEAFRHEDSKTVVGRARLTEQVGVISHRLLVAWAADCAERVLPLFQQRQPDDTRPADALSAVRRWLIGDASVDEVKNAYAYAADAADAYTAAAAAAAAAAAYTADAAADAAYTADAYTAAAAADAADAAADAAAADAAYAYTADAADAKRREERQWQGERLLAYLRGDIVIPGDEVRA